MQVHIVCLSSGNYDGLGEIRKEELIKSASFLGVNKEHCLVVDVDGLRDHPTQPWNRDVVSRTVKEYLVKHNIRKVIYFVPANTHRHLDYHI